MKIYLQIFPAFLEFSVRCEIIFRFKDLTVLGWRASNSKTPTKEQKVGWRPELGDMGSACPLGGGGQMVEV